MKGVLGGGVDLDLERAIGDYSEMIRLRPTRAQLYLFRGIAHMYSSSVAEALTDVSRTNDINAKDAYAVLWLDIADKRSDQPSRLVEATEQIDMTEWPTPIIRLYLGQTTREAVLAAADDSKAETKNGRRCETNFFLGEFSLERGDKNEARGCSAKRQISATNFRGVYGFAPIAELKALGATP